MILLGFQVLTDVHMHCKTIKGKRIRDFSAAAAVSTDRMSLDPTQHSCSFSSGEQVFQLVIHQALLGVELFIFFNLENHLATVRDLPLGEAVDLEGHWSGEPGVVLIRKLRAQIKPGGWIGIGEVEGDGVGVVRKH